MGCLGRSMPGHREVGSVTSLVWLVTAPVSVNGAAGASAIGHHPRVAFGLAVMLSLALSLTACTTRLPSPSLITTTSPIASPIAVPLPSASSQRSVALSSSPSSVVQFLRGLGLDLHEEKSGSVTRYRGFDTEQSV